MKPWSQQLYRGKLALKYALAKLRPVHPLLPDGVLGKLPRDWNREMFRTAFRSGGQVFYTNYYCELQRPDSPEPRADVPERYRLSASDIEAFYRDGCLGPFDLMSAEAAEELRSRMAELVDAESQFLSQRRGDFEFVDSAFAAQSDEQREENQRFYAQRLNCFNRHLEEPAFVEMLRDPAVTERCAQLLGPDLLLWHTNFFMTPAGSPGTPWHQTSTWLNVDWNNSFLHPPNADELFSITCWVALTDVPKERACLRVIPDSQDKIYPVRRVSADGESMSRTYGAEPVTVDFPFEDAEPKLLEAKAGQFFLICERVMHGSTPNTTEDARWAIAGRITTPKVRVYTEEMLTKGFNIFAYGIRHARLDRWGAVLLRGEDSTGLNRLHER